jgi:hypothetical protein
MNLNIPNIRPAVLRDESLVLLDKIRAFRHFIRHGYGCELDEKALNVLQNLMKENFSLVENDLTIFRNYILELSKEI